MKPNSVEISEGKANEHEQTKTDRKIFDIEGIVLYLTEQGAKGVTINFVRNLLNSGAIPRRRIGKRFHATKESIDAWLERSQRRAR